MKLPPNLGQILGLFLWLNYLSKIKIEIYHLWHDYQIGFAELSQRYQVDRSNIDYLLALIKRNFSVFYPNHKWYSTITEFKLNR